MSQMRKAKLKNLSDLSYETKIPYGDLQRLLARDLDRKGRLLLERLANFFGCKTTSIMSSGSMIWKFKGNAYDPITGLVYFIKSEETGLIKIGYSKDLMGRINGLRQEHKAEMELIHYISTYDSVGLEQVMHTLFSEKRINGEWFDLSEEDIRRIKGEQKNSPVVSSN